MAAAAVASRRRLMPDASRSLRQQRSLAMCGPLMFVRYTPPAPAASFLIFLLGSASAATPRAVLAKIDRVSDGDAITAITGDQTMLRVRLLGIDAPEILRGAQ